MPPSGTHILTNQTTIMLLGVTGGVATGKSTFCQLLANHREFAFFDADRCVHDLLDGDPVVADAILRQFGPSAFSPEGAVDRAALRAIVFRDPAQRSKLEAILHPAVRARWTNLASEHRASGRDFIADIPLLFETAAENHFDATIAVGSSPGVQQARMLARGIDPATANAMLASQWPVAKKIALASFAVWNDGSADALETQAVSLIASIFDSRP